MAKPPLDLKTLGRKQRELSNKIIIKPPFKNTSEITTVAGLDVHFAPNGSYSAACVVMKYPDIKVIEKSLLKKRAARLFPYISGFLSFREMPPLISVLKTLKIKPDVILCDGQGIAHPRRLGLASHLGVTLETSTIGCAKSHLYGKFQEPPPGLKGAYQFIKDSSDDLLGIVLRTRAYTKPLFVSPGHKMDIETAGDIVMACCKNFRIPEPLRLAHQMAKNG